MGKRYPTGNVKGLTVCTELYFHDLTLLILFFFLSLTDEGIGASVQFSSVQSLSCVRLFATPWTVALEKP